MSRGYTNNVNTASSLYNFLVDNTNVEWGLAGHRNGTKMNYTIYTRHQTDVVTSVFAHRGISKLVFELHNHPRGTMSNSGDMTSAASLDRASGKYPRHFVITSDGNPKRLYQYNSFSTGDNIFYSGDPTKKNNAQVINGNLNIKNLE